MALSYLAQALVSLCPGAQWTMQADDLSTLVWQDTIQVRPTDAAINTEAARIASLAPAAATRAALINADATRADLLNRLRIATPAQISAYVDSNVTDIPSANALFKKILLVLAQV